MGWGAVGVRGCAPSGVIRGQLLRARIEGRGQSVFKESEKPTAMSTIPAHLYIFIGCNT